MPGVDSLAVARAAVLLALLVLAGALGGGGSAWASLGLVLAVPGRTREMPGLVGSIASGALVLAVLGWAGATLVNLQVSPALAAGLGIAVGGGVGAMAWFLAVGETGPDGPETVAVEMADEEGGPSPRPADLFAASPDPIVFFAGDPPVVRAVNPAFEEVFGASSAALEDADLAEALAFDETDEVLSAVRSGGTYDEVVECRTEDGTRAMRLRIAAPGGATGYLLYTPVGG